MTRLMLLVSRYTDPAGHRQLRWLLARKKVLRRRTGTLKHINRLAIVVRPKEPFYAWTRSLEGNSAIGLKGRQLPSKVYLVDQVSLGSPERALRRHYQSIFAVQLHSWHLVEANWPARRTWQVFQQWFEAEVIDPVLDLGNHRLHANPW